MIRRGRPQGRFLATILFTDIVGSTDLASQMGDREWRRVVAAHHSIIRQQLRRFGGQEVDTAGDGFFASFDQPAQALRAADSILAEVATLGLALRAGVHTGECEMIGSKVGGIAVHIAARVMATAEAGQVHASSTTRDLVTGSGLEFSDAGSHALKGVPGVWQLFALRRVAPVGEADDSRLVDATDDDAARAGRRRRLIALLVGTALVATIISVAGAAALGVFNRPPAAAAAEPGPNTVVALDRATGDVAEVWPVPVGPVALEISADRMWVAALEAGVITDMDIGADQGMRTTGRVGRPTDLAVGDGTIWVADAFDKQVALIDEATGDVGQTVGDVLARRIGYGFGSGWATDDLRDRVLRLDRQSGAVAQFIQLEPGSYPSAIAIGSEHVWVANSGTRTVVRIDPVGATIATAAIPLRATPYDIVAGTADVWVLARETDQLLRIDPVSNSVNRTSAVCDEPASIAVDGDTVWVGCAGSGSHAVWHLDRDGAELSVTDVRGVPSDIVVTDDRVYVSVREP